MPYLIIVIGGQHKNSKHKSTLCCNFFKDSLNFLRIKYYILYFIIKMILHVEFLHFVFLTANKLT